MGLVIFLASNVVPKALVTMTKASSAGAVSINNSYLIGEKILAEADGKDKCKVNVFLTDNDGKAVQGKSVGLTGANNIEPSTKATDATGKASFEISSTEEGQFTLSASVGGVALSKKVTITFRND